MMIICPWCGTNYLTFQPNCINCGGPLPLVDEKSTAPGSGENILPPPSAPRPVSDRYVWRLMVSGGGWIVALVFGILGAVFSLVGAALTLAIITAFVGIPFLLLGIGFLVTSGWVFMRRYQDARKMVTVLQEGEAARGQIVEIHQNFNIRVNGQCPWVIRYQFQANGQDNEATVTTFNQPGPYLQVGKAVYVLYLPAAPKWNSIYPHP